MIEQWGVDHTWTLFLDRDGVINRRKWGGYIERVDEFEFLPGAAEAIAFFSRKFVRVIIVTNQQGIGKGIMTERNLLDIHRYMLDCVEQLGGKVSACYFAAELKSDRPQLRKPAPGMALQAKADFPEIDFSKSIMVGDTDSDIQFGMNLEMRTIRIRSEEKNTIPADLEVESLHAWKEQENWF